MCNENINPIINLDFSQGDDSLNWINNSINPIITDSGKLVIRPESALSVFARGLGNIDPGNNRLRYKMNVEIYRPANSGSAAVLYVVQILNGLDIVGESTIYIEGIEAGQAVKYSLDRTYSYEELSGNISIRIKSSQGWQNELRLENLEVFDFNFCEDNVRTYFVFDQLFENSQTAMSAGIRCLSWKVGGVETLTEEFMAQNQSGVGGNPLSGWKFAKAEIDGRNRVAAATERNTFNPFSDEFGLVFDTANSYWGGKPTATVNGQNFGPGVMQLGFDKPTILNGLLQPQSGAFFIDIDYSKNLYIEMDVLVNEDSSSVYNSPTTYRKYLIIWDIEKCSKSFYYINQLQQTPQANNQDHNGFLSGVTGITKEDNILPCGQGINFTGNQGAYSFTLDLGTGIGMAGINFNAQNIPDKFDIAWNEVFITSNYRGLSTYNQQLLNAGIPPDQIATNTPTSGAGQLLFFKTAPFPSVATITVTAPLGSTGWSIVSICPQPYMQVQLFIADCSSDLTGMSFFNAFLPTEQPIGFTPNTSDQFFTGPSLTIPYDGGNTIYRMRIPLGNNTFAEVPYSFLIDTNGMVYGIQAC